MILTESLFFTECYLVMNVFQAEIGEQITELLYTEIKEDEKQALELAEANEKCLQWRNPEKDNNNLLHQAICDNAEKFASFVINNAEKVITCLLNPNLSEYFNF